MQQSSEIRTFTLKASLSSSHRTQAWWYLESTRWLKVAAGYTDWTGTGTVFYTVPKPPYSAIITGTSNFTFYKSSGWSKS